MSLPTAGRFPAPFSYSNAVGLGGIGTVLIWGLQPVSYSVKQVLATTATTKDT